LTRIPAEPAGYRAPDGSEIWSPRLTVTVAVGKKSFGYQAIVDSGADNSLISAELVESVGAKWEKMTDPLEQIGAGGPFETRLCGGQIYYAGVLICNGLRVAEPGKMPAGINFLLLGRGDFFSKFVASFHWDESPPWFEVDLAPPKK
jgi:hypothetical protein